MQQSLKTAIIRDILSNKTHIGAIDNDTENTNPDKTKYVDNATQVLLVGDSPKVTFTKAVGCAINYKK